jgi:hypothetical protein
MRTAHPGGKSVHLFELGGTENVDNCGSGEYEGADAIEMGSEPSAELTADFNLGLVCFDLNDRVARINTISRALEPANDCPVSYRRPHGRHHDFIHKALHCSYRVLSAPVLRGFNRHCLGFRVPQINWESRSSKEPTTARTNLCLLPPGKELQLKRPRHVVRESRPRTERAVK